MMEHLICDYILNELEEKDWFFKGQHAYSCESHIISFFHDLTDDIYDGGRVDSVVIDLAKAFDVVLHDIVLKTLSRTGIDKRVVLWVQEFLSDRTQRVKIGYSFSELGMVTNGVPQGSVIVPLFFLTHINDLPTNINLKVKLFADDCIIYRRIEHVSDEIELQNNLIKVSNWATGSKMKINSGKSTSVYYTKSRREVLLDYKIDGKAIPQDKSCKYLGIHLLGGKM